MPDQVIRFKNSGHSEYNDIVYREKTFDLLENDYSVLINPESSYWRFGLVLSKTPDFDFEPQLGRYKNTALKFVQLNVGDFVNNNWSAANKLEFTTYYIDKGVLDRYEKYTGLSPLTLDVVSGSEVLTFTVRDAAASDALFNTSLLLPGYRYFRLFAWADYIEFSVNCTISILSKTSAESKASHTPTSTLAERTCGLSPKDRQSSAPTQKVQSGPTTCFQPSCRQLLHPSEG